MNTILKILGLVLAFLGVFAGCGGEPPPPTSNDALVDSGTGRDVAPTGDRPGGCVERIDRVGRFTCNNGVEVCMPDVRGSEYFMCVGATMCQPNEINPTCAGALDCTCAEVYLPSTVERTCNNDRACEDAVRQMLPQLACSPGHNRCSVNLPDGMEYAPFFDQDDGRQTFFRIMLDYQWYLTVEGVPGTVGLGRTMTSRGGPTAFMLSGLARINWSPETGILECTGTTCYSRRSSALRRILPSYEMRFVDRCEFELLEFEGDTSEPVHRSRYIASPCPSQ